MWNQKKFVSHWKTWTIVFRNETHEATVNISWNLEKEAIVAAYDSIIEEYGQSSEWELAEISSVPYQKY